METNEKKIEKCVLCGEETVQKILPNLNRLAISLRELKKQIEMVTI